jgi:cytochrome c-type biogenesis protein CcmE
VTDGVREVRVVFAKEVPDTFKENGDVVVEGRPDAGGVFQARMLLAKCPSKYEKEGMEGQQHPDDASSYSGGGS